MRLLDFEIRHVVAMKIREFPEPCGWEHAEHEEVGLLPWALFWGQPQFICVALYWSWIEVAG
jgi:hypothetical protein